VRDRLVVAQLQRLRDLVGRCLAERGNRVDVAHFEAGVGNRRGHRLRREFQATDASLAADARDPDAGDDCPLFGNLDHGRRP